MSTLDHQTRSEIARASNRRGKEAEQAVARWLREHGWPDAQRTVRTGWRAGDHQSRDRGDIDGTPRLAWQVKTSASDFTDTGVRNVLAATTEQAVAAGADYGIAVERRVGKTSPGRWHAWMTAGDLHNLTQTARKPDMLTTTEPRLDVPVRLLLEDLAPLLYAAGYGTPATTEADREPQL